jgi:predicted nucleotidyltransferase
MDERMRERIDRAAKALQAAGAREVYLFGSATTDAFDEGSDVDMAVSGLPPERFFKAMGMARRALRRPLDLVDLDEDTPFTRCLRKEGEMARVG